VPALPAQPAATPAVAAAGDRVAQPGASHVASEHVLGEFDYAHPVFDQAAMAAQQRMPLLQGNLTATTAGAWMGYGFHEDGLKAGQAAAALLLKDAGVTQPDDSLALVV
jgi:predicted NAD/FAD-binding protein